MTNLWDRLRGPRPVAAATPGAVTSAAPGGQVLQRQVFDRDRAAIDEQPALASAAVDREAVALDIERVAGLEVDRFQRGDHFCQYSVR